MREQQHFEPSLGKRQEVDATPVEARRREEKVPYHPHYKVRMHKLEARWDAECEALLAHQF